MREKNISEDRKKYLRKIKQGKAAVIITQLLILIIFIMSWEILANQGIIDSFITSQPSRIFDTFLNLSSNGLLRHLGITLTETLIGFISGVLLGVAIAICLWWSTFLSKVSEPYLVILNSLPKVALRSCHYNLGRSAECGAIITMGLAISLIVTVLEILNGFLNTDKELMKMAKTFGASKFQLLTKIVIPANINTFFNSLKVNIGLSLVGVITGEFLVSKAGLRILNSIWRSSISTRPSNDRRYNSCNCSSSNL